jgi:hypothetical protein
MKEPGGGKPMGKKTSLIVIGIVAAVAALSILSYTMLANHPPVITGLAAEPQGAHPLGSCQIACNATDPDGDYLSYGWSAEGGRVVGDGATVTWTAPDSLGLYLITVTVTDGRGRAATDHVYVAVNNNESPTIDRLEAEAQWITPSGSLQVACTASDFNDDVLSYEWATTGGDISGTGAVVSWTAPQEIGIYNVTVAVEDGYGGGDTEFLSLSVAIRIPPTIETLTVNAKEPKYLKTTSTGYTVGRAKQYDIGCSVVDPDDIVSYSWSCESGVISGQGPMATWTAPDESFDGTTVTVVVSDVYGSMAVETIVFTVASCTPCTFG